MPINSVDVQPRGYRILTGGSDNKVCILNLLPIISRKYEVQGLMAENAGNEEKKIEIEVDQVSAIKF